MYWRSKDVRIARYSFIPNCTDKTGAYFFVFNHCSVATAVLLLTGSEMSTLAGLKMSTLAA